MSTIPQFFENSARKFPNKTALIIDKKNYTYKELEQQIRSFSSAILRYPQKSVISIMFENSLEFVVSYIGILRAGCIAHLIMPGITERNLVEQIQSAKPRAIVTSKDFFLKCQKIGDDKFEILEFSDLKPNETKYDRKLNSNDFAYLIYTSGTTSNPKGVGISHGNVVFTTNNIVSVLKYVESDIDEIGRAHV